MYMKEMNLNDMAAVTGGAYCIAADNETDEPKKEAPLAGPWGKSWGESGGWGSGNPNQEGLKSGPWGKSWGEGGWGSCGPRKKMFHGNKH